LWYYRVSFHARNNTYTQTDILPIIRPFITEEDQKSDLEVQALLNNTVLYNAMIHPFTRMVIKGAIWYQGMHIYFTIKVNIRLLQENRILIIIVINTIVPFPK
jgi:hypothetical protein